MAQLINNIVGPETLAKTDYRRQFVELNTAASDFATAETSLVMSTYPFLPAGDNFVDIPLYPLGMTQSFNYNEGTNGMFVGEMGTTRKTSTVGGSMGSGSISRLQVHGNALLVVLYRPTIIFMEATKTLSALKSKIQSPSDNPNWIRGFSSEDVDLFTSDLDAFVDKVVAGGGMSSLLTKVPFGLIQVLRDAREEVLSINFFENCSIRGEQGGLSAGQFQVGEAISFEFERKRPLNSVGAFSLSTTPTAGA